ncbi:MAG: PKD domain-containing protein [Nitrososphaera sp.]
MQDRKKNMAIFGGLGAAAVIIAALYIMPLFQAPATAKSSPLRATADNFFKIRVGEDAPFFSEAKGGKGPYQYQWEFGDGAKSTDKTTTHIYTKEGTYKVILTVTDSTGAKTSVSHDVSVFPRDANFTRGDDIMRQ